MATYQSFPGAPPGVVAGGLKFGNNQVLVSETQPGATAGQFLVATSATTLGFVTVSPAVYVDGLNTSTPGSPVTTNSSTPLMNQYLRTKFSTTNAIWDYAYQPGVRVFNDTLINSDLTIGDADSIVIGIGNVGAGISIGKNNFVTGFGIVLGNGTTTTQGIAIGSGASSLNEGVAVGYSSTCTSTGVVVGGAASATSGVRVGFLGSVTTGVAIGNTTTATDGVSIGTNVTSGASGTCIGTNILATGLNSVVIGLTSNDAGVQDVTLVGQNTITKGGAGSSTGSAMFGFQNTLTTTTGGNATRCLIVGSQNSWTTTAGGNISRNSVFGNNNTMTTGASNATNNLILGNDHTVNGGVTNSTTLGSGMTNARDSSIVAGAAGAPYFLYTPNGIKCFHTVVHGGSSGSIVTVPAALAGHYIATQAGAANLTLPTGTALDTNTDIANNLWVGMSFRWKLVHTNTGILTILGTTGHTYTGPNLDANSALDILTVRTGVNTWVSYGS